MKDFAGVILFFFVGWLIASIIVAVIGSDRKIGGFVAFIASIVFSPIFGALIVIASDKKLARESDQDVALAIQAFFNGEYDKALQLLQIAVKVDPFSPKIHLYLAEVYSAKKESQRSFKHFKTSVEHGLVDFSPVYKSKHFEFLRKLPEFREFEQNGFDFTQGKVGKEDIAGQIERIARLLQDGFITKDEFDVIKKKLIEPK